MAVVELLGEPRVAGAVRRPGHDERDEAHGSRREFGRGRKPRAHLLQRQLQAHVEFVVNSPGGERRLVDDRWDVDRRSDVGHNVADIASSSACSTLRVTAGGHDLGLVAPELTRSRLRTTRHRSTTSRSGTTTCSIWDSAMRPAPDSISPLGSVPRSSPIRREREGWGARSALLPRRAPGPSDPGRDWRYTCLRSDVGWQRRHRVRHGLFDTGHHR